MDDETTVRPDGIGDEEGQDLGMLCIWTCLGVENEEGGRKWRNRTSRNFRAMGKFRKVQTGQEKKGKERGKKERKGNNSLSPSLPCSSHGDSFYLTASL